MTSVTMSMKLKSIWGSLFQAQNTFLIKKSMINTDSCASGSLSDDSSKDYRIRREKNNESVRKSRAKNRIKLQECANHVQDLKIENTKLNKELDNLQTELHTLRDLFNHCFSFDPSNLDFKPSDVPTSTLYKLVMNQNTSILSQKTNQ